MRFLLGLFDPIDDQPYWHVPPSVVNTPETQAINLLATQQSIVLLKNDKNTLPFSIGKTIAMIGPHANSTDKMVGNYIPQICPGGENDFSCIISPLEAVKLENKGGTVLYAEGCTISSNSTKGFAEAIATAKKADYVVLLLGLDQSIEAEEHDRDQITLPGVQSQLAQQILQIGKPTAIVLLNGGIVAIDDLKQTAPAILEAWYPAYQGGVAISNVIFGSYNPGGKLPVTLYSSDYVHQVDFASMSMTKAPGRSYRYYTGTPLYPFGYGLSYTTFEILWWSAKSTYHPISNDGSEKVVFFVNVTNTGKIAGDEVVQAYFSPSNKVKSQLKDNPLIKQLFGFQRVHVLPGNTVTISFALDSKTLALTDYDGTKVSVPGDYSIIFTNGVDSTVTIPFEVTGNAIRKLKYI